MIAVLLVASMSVAASAESPLVARARSWVTRYHEDPARLDALRADLARSIAIAPNVDALVALAHVCFLWGDVRARNVDDKLGAYAEGRDAAKQAAELAPRSAPAHFWYATNVARWGQTKGIMRSLFLLPTLRREMDAVFALDPTYTPVYSLAGQVYSELPAVLGGDLAKSEQMFRAGLALDARFTGMRVGLARTLIKQGRIAEARTELEAVLAETAPGNPADWALRDSKEARALLGSLGRPS